MAQQGAVEEEPGRQVPLAGILAQGGGGVRGGEGVLVAQPSRGVEVPGTAVVGEGEAAGQPAGQ